MTFRYAICNETFPGRDHVDVCRLVAELGYTGLEMAPFTLAGRVTDILDCRRRDIRRHAEAEGLQIVGLHWLLAKTDGLHLTSADPAVRRATGEYLAELARFCRDLGGDFLVFGSPQQRSIPSGVTHEQAADYAAEAIALALPALDNTGVRLCLEPLTPAETNFWNTCAETAAFVERVGHPSVCLHLDVKAMASEGVPVADLVRRHASRAGHFHANDSNRRGPGFGPTDFRPIFAALADAGYKGWVSVETFDYSPDPEAAARESLRYMRECEPA